LIKWSPWILPATPIPTPESNPSYDNVVGLFEGARYKATGMYRPKDSACLMHFLGVPFGEVCAQEYILRLYAGGWGIPSSGIDPIEPGSESPPTGGTVDGSRGVAFSVDLLQPVGSPPLQVTWLVDGVPQPAEVGTQTTSFELAPPQAGTYQVEVQVEDVTPLVHPDMAGTLLESARAWTVEAAQPCDTDGDGVCDSEDNCVDRRNPSQRDTDRDGLGNACDVVIKRPWTRDRLDCRPGARRPRIVWRVGNYDRFRGFLSSDGRFPSRETVTSGKPLLSGRSWRVPRTIWRDACRLADSSLFIKVLGVDTDLPDGDPARKTFSQRVKVRLRK
jgi:hypothetical protein